jgi:hypothetical protein
MNARIVTGLLWALISFAIACRGSGSGERGAPATPAVLPEECRLRFDSASEQDRRFLKSLEADCQPLDRCILACVASGCGANVGGGCAHLCSSGVRNGDEDYLKRAAFYLGVRGTGSCD